MLRKLIKVTRRAVREEDGITAVEYAILAALVAAGLAAAVPVLNTAISTAFSDIAKIITPTT
jgi:pilus assembly protein Flp/PilA